MTVSYDQLSDQKRALLEQRLQRARAKTSAAPTLQPRPADAPQPLSTAQQRLWFLAQYEPDSPAYSIPIALHLRGALDLAALEAAFNALIARHEILRTTYAIEGEDAAPILHEDATAPLAVVDLRDQPAEQRERAAAVHRDEDARRPFDLTSDLPIRTTVLRLTDDESLLLINLHHIAADGWSISILFRELAALYVHQLDAAQPVPPPLTVQYGDWAYWQRQQLAGPALQTQLSYWRKRLADAPPALDLPTDRPRPAINSHRGQIHTFTLDADLARSIRSCAQQHNITPFMLFLTALHTLLHRYTGSDDVSVGSPIAGRTHSGAEGLIGCFVNTLALRGDLSGNPTVRELLGRVRELTLDAYANQDVPFEKLVEELRPERNLSYTPFFQVMLNVHNTPQTPLELPGLVTTDLGADSGTAKFDLNLAVVDDGAVTAGTLTYNTDLYDPATIERLVGHLTSLLAGMVASPDARIDELPLLTPAERETILHAWNATATQHPAAQAVHQLFEQQAARVPDAIAVSFEGQDLTYADLNRRANQLAWHLRALGVGPDDRVGLYVERSLDLIVGMIGILKAGGAYLPIDPIYPNDRVGFMLRDAGARIVVTHGQLGAGLLDDLRTVRLDADWPAIAAGRADNPPLTVAPANLMYVLFTSGSTGRPKGVAVEHRNYLNYIHGAIERLDLEPGLSYALVSTFAADLGTTNIYGALCTGGRLHVIAYERATDPEAFADYFRRHRIDVMKLTPSHFESLQSAVDLAAITPHERLIFAGEASRWEHIAEIQRRLPGRAIQNHYGPTETTVSMLTYPLPPKPPAYHTASVPLGRPLGNVRIAVLDRRMQPLPIGAPGELYIGGAGVARGYLERPALTAEKFVPDPWGAPGQRMYRTGDLVRWLPDGCIEFLGRIDQQVKIRGYRVEPTEIETLIGQFPGVHETVVIVREDSPGDKRLVAYVVGEPKAKSQEPTENKRTNEQGSQESTDHQSLITDHLPALREYLKERLPEYMVPSVFVTLPALPLNPNGKIDRKALPAPDASRRASEDAFVAPRTALEQQIAAVWAEVLGLEQIGIDDNFFDLGGESFKAIRVTRKIDRRVSVIELFKRPTIRALAASLEQPVDQAAPQGLLHRLTRAVAGTPTASLICLPYGGGSAITFQPLANALPAGYALYGVQLPGHDLSRPDEPLLSIDEVARQLVAELQRDVSGPLVIYGHCLGGALAVELARQLERSSRTVAGVILGGTFPAARLPGRLFELLYRIFPTDRLVSNRAYHDYLRAMGGFTDVIDPQEQAMLIRSLRHDAREAEEFYSRMYQDDADHALAAPILCIVGQRDRATELYQERYAEWRHFSAEVDLAVIAKAGHYFLKHQATALAGLIVRQVETWQGAPAAEQIAEPHAQTITPQPVAPRARRSGAPSLATFFMVALGQLISMIGTGLSSFALGVWVYQQTGSVSDFAFISVVALLPGILLAPLAGAIADRWDRRLVMIASDTLAAIGTLGLAALLWSGSLQIWHVYIVTALGALANAFQRPAYLAAVAQLVPKRYLGQANGIVQLGGAVGDLLAPLIGGGLVLLIGLHGIVMIDMASFLVAVTTLLLVRFPNMLFVRREEPLMREVVSGWRYIVKRPSLVAMVVFFVVFNYLFSIPTVLVTPLVLAFASPVALGTVMAASGLGALFGSLVMSFWGGTRRRATGMVGFTIVFGLATAIMGLGAQPIFPTIGLFGLWAALIMINAHWMSLIQSKVGLELQGRVLATNQMMASSMMPLGFLTAGPLADRIFEPLLQPGGLLAPTVGALIGTGPGRGMALLLIIVGGLLMIWGAIGLRYRPLRYMEDILPDALPDAEIADDKDALQAEADRLLQPA